MEPLIAISLSVLSASAVCAFILTYLVRHSRIRDIAESSVMPFDRKRGRTYKDLGCGRQSSCKLWKRDNRKECWDCDHRRIVRTGETSSKKKVAR